ncbi:hypothetical protein RHMOL_Rhmol04G0011200 [Rhododendron molle]|uniref:Uncharacterized protein n=1 Tax=Rhododendron molle TaxID=49168 RepID=A0ACC0NXC1_RHOML|nr:hypothetical protein RHMOL_Rhmol04G0011200 [Rhododendron molle]
MLPLLVPSIVFLILSNIAPLSLAFLFDIQPATKPPSTISSPLIFRSTPKIDPPRSLSLSRPVLNPKSSTIQNRLQSIIHHRSLSQLKFSGDFQDGSPVQSAYGILFCVFGQRRYASIRAIENNSNSNMQNLVAYWILFSLVSLFAFVNLIDCSDSPKFEVTNGAVFSSDRKEMLQLLSWLVALPKARVKFNVRITDPTGSTEAAMFPELAPLRNWKSIMSCLCCSNDDMQRPSDNAQFMGNNASECLWLEKWLITRHGLAHFGDLTSNNAFDLRNGLPLEIFLIVSSVEFPLAIHSSVLCIHWITKDGSQLLSWLYLRKRAIQFMRLLGHQILADDSYLGLLFTPYEVITTGTHKQIAIWHLGLNPNLDGKLSTEKERMCFFNLSLQILYFRDQVWEMEWNISGMTLATTGVDGVVSNVELKRHSSTSSF